MADLQQGLQAESGVENVMNESKVTFVSVLINIFLFVAAGICEIGGGYCTWQAVRGNKPKYWAIIGSVILVIYGFIPPFQSDIWKFSTIYATYGGIFIVLSLLFGWIVENDRPDMWDGIGCLIALIGCAVMMYVPRKDD